MSLPPDNITPSELWMKLQEMPRPSKVVDFPRLDVATKEPVGKMAMWVLKQEERYACIVSAEKVALEKIKQGKKGELAYELLFSDLLVMETLYRACRDENDLTRPAFLSPKAIREVLTTEECARLYDHYLTIQLELGPLISEMSEDEFDGWIQRVAEADSSFPLDMLSPELQKRLFLSMAKRLASYLTDTSSSSSDASEPGTS